MATPPDERTDTLLLLRGLPLFNALSYDGLSALARGAAVRQYAKGTPLFEAGERPEHLHVLVEGAVQLTAGESHGAAAVVELLRPVDSFIMAAVLTSQPYLMSASTVEPSRILLIPAGALLSRVTADPQLALGMLGSLAHQYRQMVRQVKDLRLRTAAQRLGVYLLRERQGERADGEVALGYEKRLVAARLAMSPESLSRAIAALRRHGVEVHGVSVHIVDVDKLQHFCDVDHVLDRLDEDLCTLTPHCCAANEAG